MPIIRIGNALRWQAYPPLLVTQLCRAMFVNYYVKLGLKLLRGICNPVIDLKRTNQKWLSNSVTESNLWKYYKRKTTFMTLILLYWTFHKIQKNLLMTAFSPYQRDIRNKCKELRVEHLIHQYFMISSTVRVKVQENSSPKAITHMIDLEQVLPEVEIERFKVFSLHKK